jgi:Putative peptidoglycan binding domain
MRFRVIDDCPVPEGIADQIEQIRELSGARLNSCDRSPEAEPTLRRCGKMSQRQLWEAWTHHEPGANPANRPGTSTHERRNDGVAYAGKAGDRLKYWQVGMDWNDPPAAMAAARQLGWIASVTYPQSIHETQHVNFRKQPDPTLPTAAPGDDGPAVKAITRALASIQSPISGRPYLPEAFPHYGRQVTAAVKRFQREHHQKPDGVVGPHTATQLAVSLRRHRRRPRPKAKAS